MWYWSNFFERRFFSFHMLSLTTRLYECYSYTQTTQFHSGQIAYDSVQVVSDLHVANRLARGRKRAQAVLLRAKLFKAIVDLPLRDTSCRLFQ